jgi:hypothetical protein
MTARLILGWLIAGAALSPAICRADDSSKDTITVVKENATPDDVVSKIVLPTKASDKGREQSQKGLDTANNARAARGNETAAEAREQGREFGENTAADARHDNPSSQLREEASEARNNGNSGNRKPPTPPGKH